MIDSRHALVAARAPLRARRPRSMSANPMIWKMRGSGVRRRATEWPNVAESNW